VCCSEQGEDDGGHCGQHYALLLMTRDSSLKTHDSRFMTWCVAGSKEKMMEAIVDRQVRQYQVSEYEKGQRATDYTTWLTSNVHYNAKFEEVRVMPPHCTVAPLPGLLCDCSQGQGQIIKLPSVRH